MKAADYETLCADYEERGLWKRYTHSDKLHQCAERCGDRIALIDEREEISFAELERRADAMAEYFLQQGFVCATYPDDPFDIILNTQGRPISPGDILKIVDENDREVPHGTEGEIIAIGPSVVTEYYGVPELTKVYFTDDGFYRTGDKGVISPETGCIRILGRTREQINRLGEKIMPSELEERLADYPGADLVCVTPASDAELGQRICLFFQPKSDADTSQFALQQVRTYLTARQVAVFKLPDQVMVLDRLPLTKVGKIDRKRLREMAEETN